MEYLQPSKLRYALMHNPTGREIVVFAVADYWQRKVFCILKPPPHTKHSLPSVRRLIKATTRASLSSPISVRILPAGFRGHPREYISAGLPARFSENVSVTEAYHLGGLVFAMQTRL